MIMATTYQHEIICKVQQLIKWCQPRKNILKGSQLQRKELTFNFNSNNVLLKGRGKYQRKLNNK